MLPRQGRVEGEDATFKYAKKPIIFRTSFKKEPSASCFLPLFTPALSPVSALLSRGYYLHACAGPGSQQCAASPGWAEGLLCMLQVIRGAERMCIYLLKVLYKSIPCFWTQVNRNNSETQPTTTATLKQHFQGIDFLKSIFSWHYSHHVGEPLHTISIVNKHECACTCVCTSAWLPERKGFYCNVTVRKEAKPGGAVGKVLIRSFMFSLQVTE